MYPNRFEKPDEAELPVEGTLEDFYFKVSGFRVIFGNDESGWFFRGNEIGIPTQLDRINLGTSSGRNDLGESDLAPYLGTVSVSNIDKSIEVVIENGGEPIDLKVPVTDGYWCFCKDPAKNMFSLFQEEKGVRTE